MRAALERSGLDHGPISVFEKLKAMGLEPVPSVPSLPGSSFHAKVDLPVGGDFGVGRTRRP